MNNEQLIKDVIRWIITSKNTEMLDASDVDLVYKDYITEQVGNVAKPNACPQLYEVAPKTEIRDPDTLHRYYMCPNSKCFGGFKAIKRDFEYCPYCGVKLSWRLAYNEKAYAKF